LTAVVADTKRGRLTTGEIVVVAAGAVGLIFSFLPWYTAGPFQDNAWDSGLFPVATLVPILGALMMVQVLVDRLTGATLSSRVGDFTWEQLLLVAAAGALLVAFCYFVRTREPAVSFGFGFYVDLLAAVALVVGAVMIRNERGRRGPSTSL